MEKRNLIEGKLSTAREVIVDSEENSIWYVRDIKTRNTFIIKVSKKGELYIDFFKEQPIPQRCSIEGISNVCEELLNREIKPTIEITSNNKNLIIVCRKVGFRKTKGIERQYYLKMLKGRN